MAIDKEIIALLSEFGKDITVDLKSNLKKRLEERAAKTLAKSKYKDKSVKKLTSRLEASILANPVKYVNGGLLFTLTMNDYWDAVNSGRKPTTKSGDGSLRKNLIRWIKTRKLKIEVSKRKQAKASTLKNKKVKKTYKKQTFDEAVEAASYAIAKKIHKDGYEGNHFYDEVIKDGRIDKLKEDIAKLINTEIIIDIQQTTKQ